MNPSAALELITDTSGSVTFGWLDDGVYYARFSRCLSAQAGESFATRLRVALRGRRAVKYFSDASALESYDLLARSAIVRVMVEMRRKFETVTLLSWEGGEPNASYLSTLRDLVHVSKSDFEFEASLLAAAPRARMLLQSGGTHQRSRWTLRR